MEIPSFGIEHRLGEDHLPGFLAVVLQALGFREPSWAAIFVVVFGVAMLCVAAVALWALVVERGEPDG